MSTVYVGHRRVEPDHFQPDQDEDAGEQRRRRGRLEAIDYTAFAANQEVVARMLGRATPESFQALALAAAQARAAWVGEALKAGGAGGAPDVAVGERLRALRVLAEELIDAYEAARRLVERGYLVYEADAAA